MPKETRKESHQPVAHLGIPIIPNREANLADIFSPRGQGAQDAFERDLDAMERELGFDVRGEDWRF